ncbi:MAG TPA: phosphoglycerate dehydrogenase, partial [Candidatus Marinimicrobia bacterium]|nr:phosphoglycerate dehydrogenase [Candidatus Neomarinimicrobiota bacterium]
MQVLITDPIGKVGTKILKAAGLKIVEKIGASAEELNKVLPKTDGWIVRSGTTVTRELMEAAPQLKVVGRA